jgi:hypothetical protein
MTSMDFLAATYRFMKIEDSTTRRKGSFYFYNFCDFMQLAPSLDKADTGATGYRSSIQHFQFYILKLIKSFKLKTA